MSYACLGARRLLAAEQDGICPWCKLPLPDDLADTVSDHIIPRSRGGPNRAWSRQVLHRVCNLRKGSKLTDEARALAARCGIILHEPLPTAWPGSSKPGTTGKPTPGRVKMEPKGNAA